MEVKASLKHLRMSPQKIRLVLDLVRGLSTVDALNQLKFINKKAAEPVAKLISSAVANAENNFNLDKNNLRIKEIRADEGATLKRWMPKAHGRATTIRKRATHISVTLEEIVASGKGKKKEVVLEKPVKLEDLTKEAEKTTKTAKTAKVNKKINPEKENTKKVAAPDKTKMFRRKAG
ncbi:MAG: large subunit ribosomal protein [Patescibacteria group bacterium]|nr:large subunit ribosomal protein [Patescibacteria group bacterium]